MSYSAVFVCVCMFSVVVGLIIFFAYDRGYNTGWKHGYEVAKDRIGEKVEDLVYRRYSDDGDPDQRWIDLKNLAKSLKGE